MNLINAADFGLLPSKRLCGHQNIKSHRKGVQFFNHTSNRLKLKTEFSHPYNKFSKSKMGF